MSSPPFPPPVDARGLPLRIGQLVTIGDCDHIIREIGLDRARKDFQGRKVKILKFDWYTAAGGYWQAATDNQPPYRGWPVSCLIGDSIGLRGLVSRYRKEAVDAQAR